MARYTVIESKRWIANDGRGASVYGAVPYRSAAEKERDGWRVECVGWTLRNEDNGTVGIGRPPFETKEAAENHLQLMRDRGLAS